MNKINRYLFRKFYAFFEKSMVIYEVRKQNKKKDSYTENAIIGADTRIFPEASINNNLDDKSKIIIGDNCDIRGELLIFGHGGEIIIGNYSFVGERSKIWSAKKITIGNRVLISHNVNIHDNNSHPTDSKLRHEDFKHIKTIGLQKQNNLNEQEITIEDDVWIGFNSTIMKGVKIGKGAIIGANTMVLKDVPDFAICVGNPMKIINKAQ